MSVACAQHPTCPGCSLFDLGYAQQLERKRERLAWAFAHFEHLPQVPAVLPAEHELAYRHRVKLPIHVGPKRVSIGLYDEAHRVLDTPDCPVLVEPLRAALIPLRKWLAGRQGIHSVDLRLSALTGELQLILACQGADLHGGARAARELARSVPNLKTVAVSRADPTGRRVMGSAPKVILGPASLDEGIGDTRYRLLPGAFFQVDPRQAVKLHGVVRDFVGDARTVLDLYAGVGAYALALAKGRDRVVAIEEVRQAAEAARQVAPPNVTVVTSKVEDADLGGPFDVAILNPARRGADPHTLERLGQLAERVVYVSCGPETLARDLDILATYGLRVSRVQPIDLFPQTPEVETVVLLERGPRLDRWPLDGGFGRSPWRGDPSGVEGQAEQVVALVLGDVGPKGSVKGGRFERLGLVAGHSLIRMQLTGRLGDALRSLAARRHAVVGWDRATAPFFAHKAGLVRPFVHVERAGRARAPLHGDLVLALRALRADVSTLRAVGVYDR